MILCQEIASHLAMTNLHNRHCEEVFPTKQSKINDSTIPQFNDSTI